MPLTYHHVDVFADRPYTGNSLAVFVDPPALDTAQMTRITRELRHFESIFVTTPDTGDVVHARVFDLFEELAFAGHPVLGAAAVLHAGSGAAVDDERVWTIALADRIVAVSTRADADGRVSAVLDQGRPEWIPASTRERRAEIAAALGLDVADLDPTLPVEVVSTGLRYLIVPVDGTGPLGRARIVHPDFATLLATFGAQFAYLLDARAPEGRHWNNDGVLEDVATGSAAGCVAAYLLRHGRAHAGVELTLSQGRFVDRPSTLTIAAHGTAEDVERVVVGGTVSMVGIGTLHALPPSSPA
ncbi:PhzF family phenazine biosynthesis protein [Embleya scabrispora]|uniref:PhzF family phenazine biosynthesis protein n=1 Tax=Embleya scabrispora TaxID=159449 RepID=UPI000366F1F2|nr:PhzF family phenazine biosynthesis protein [Embleya scabrispora]MYS78895.1 PhzF family phenazine biosynthesis isomerase [Streptomyces sp. SID5474]